MSLVETWLGNVAYSHSQSRNTEISYKRGLNMFLGFIEKTPEQILEEYKNSKDREFKRKYAKLVRSFISVQMKDYAIGSVGAFVSAIKSFFKYNDLPLGHVPIAKGMVVYHNRDITIEEIRLLLSMSRPRDKAFFCMMAQSGLRPHTLVRLKFKHVQPELSKKTIPCKIDVPQEIAKGKYHGYFTFMGEDSVRYLNASLLNRKQIKPNDYLFTKHGSNKPLTPNSVSVCFKTLINKLKERNEISFERISGKPAELRLYSLRKWFRKRAGSNADSSYVSFWMGHSLGVDGHYFTKDVEHHREKYAEKAMPHLTLERMTEFSKNELEKKLNPRFEDQSARIGELERQLKLTTFELKRLREMWEKYYLLPKMQKAFDKETAEDFAHQEELNREALAEMEAKRGWEWVPIREGDNIKWIKRKKEKEK